MTPKIISVGSYGYNLAVLLEDGRLYEYGFYSTQQEKPEYRPIPHPLDVPSDHGSTPDTETQ